MALRTPETATPEAIQQLTETNLANAVRIRDLEAKLADAKRHREIEESRSRVRGQTALSLTTENELLKAKLAKAEADRDKAIKALANLKAILCDPEGNGSIEGSQADNDIITDSMKILAEIAPERT